MLLLNHKNMVYLFGVCLCIININIRAISDEKLLLFAIYNFSPTLYTAKSSLRIGASFSNTQKQYHDLYLTYNDKIASYMGIKSVEIKENQTNDLFKHHIQDLQMLHFVSEIPEIFSSIFKHTLFHETANITMYSCQFFPRAITDNYYSVINTRQEIIKKLQNKEAALKACSSLLNQIRIVEEEIENINFLEAKIEVYKKYHMKKDEYLHSYFLKKKASSSLLAYDIIKDFLSLDSGMLSLSNILMNPEILANRASNSGVLLAKNFGKSLLNKILWGPLGNINELFQFKLTQESQNQIRSSFFEDLISGSSRYNTIIYNPATLGGNIVNSFVWGQSLFNSFDWRKFLFVAGNTALAGYKIYSMYNTLFNSSAKSIFILRKAIILMKKKFEKIKNLMLFYEKLLPQGASSAYEYEICKKILTNKKIQEKINNSYIMRFSSPTLFLISQYFPATITKDFVDVYETYFDIDIFRDSPLKKSTFMKLLDNFVYYVDGLCAAAKLLVQDNNFIIPTILNPLTRMQKSISISGMWNPVQDKTKINNLNLGASNPQHMLIIAPTGSGKTYYLRTIISLLYMARYGIVPAASCIIPYFENVYQNIATTFDAKQGYSKHMGEIALFNHIYNEIENNPASEYLVIFDEFYSGTTEHEIINAVKTHFEKLLKLKNFFLLKTTHFLSIFEIFKHNKDLMLSYVDVEETTPGIFKKTYQIKPLINFEHWWLSNTIEARKKRGRYEVFHIKHGKNPLIIN